MSNKITKKITSVVLSATTAVWLSGFSMLVPFAANAQATDLQAQINALLAQIAALQAQLAAQTTGGAAAPSCSFTRDLTLGSRGDDVKCLQQHLNGAGHKVAASGPGSSGSETTYFGSLTAAAVAKWQAANSVSPAAGYWGPRSRAKYTSLAAAPAAPAAPGAPAPAAPAGTGLTVTLAPDQPANGLFGESFASREFTKLRFTASADGDVTVKGLTVERGGQANDAAFSGVILLDDDGVRLGPTKTFGSDHRLILTEAFTVKAGQTRAMTLGGDSDSDQNDYNGQLLNLGLVKVDAGNTTVNASYPLTGATHTVNSTLAIGTLTVAIGAFDPGAGLTKEVGTQSVTFSGLRLVAGSDEDILLKSMRWYQNGSAGASDLSNVKINLDGTDYPATVSSDGKYYSAKFGDGLTVLKGLNKQVYIKGNVAGGSGRTVDLDVFRFADIQALGKTYNYAVLPSRDGGTAAHTATDDNGSIGTEEPNFDAYEAYIGAGTITAQNATAVGAQNIALNLGDQPLGGLLVDVKGEDVTVAAMNFDLSIVDDAATGGSINTNDITGITLVREDGTVVAGPVDGTAGGDNGIRFTNTVTFKPGRMVYTLRGKVGTDVGNNDTVAASTTPSSDWTTVRGVTSATTITPSPASAVTLSTMTVKAATLTVSLTSDTQETSNASSTAQNVVAGTGNFIFTKYVLDASGSGEDTRVTGMQLRLTYSSSNTADDITNCQLYDGNTPLNTGGNIMNPTNSESTATAAAGSAGFVVNKSFTLDTGLIVPKGTVKTVEVRCNLVSGANASGHWQWGITDVDASLTATGMTSGLSVGGAASITGTEDGRVIAARTSGTLSFALDPSSPALKWAQAGTTDNTLAIFRFNATDEDVRIDTLGLQMGTSTATISEDGTTIAMASNSPSDLTKVTVWDGATKVGEATFSASDYATATLTSVTVAKSGQKLLTVKGDLASVYSNGPGRPGHLVLINYDASSSANCGGGGDPTCQRGAVGVGMSSGVAVGSGGSDSASNGVRVSRAVPTVARVALASTKFANASSQSLYRFKVSAPAGTNGVSLYKFTFNVSTSTSSVVELPGAGSVDPDFSGNFGITNFRVYCYSDANFSVPSCGSADNSGLLNAGRLAVADGAETSQDPEDAVTSADADQDFSVRFNPTSTTGASTTEAIRVPAGEARYFLLKGDVTGASSTPSITIRMNGDSQFASCSADTGCGSSTEGQSALGELNNDITADGDNWSTGRYIFATTAAAIDGQPHDINKSRWEDDDFIWSGNSTNTTQDVADYDWFNGFMLPGLSNSDVGEVETLTLQ